MPYKLTDQQREYQRGWARKRHGRAKLVKDELRAGGCELCEEQALCALSFHHRDPSTKLFGIGDTSRMRTEAAIREEAAKCAVLCHNCHAKVHAGIVTL